MRLPVLFLALLTCAAVRGQALTPAWVELGAGGAVVARIVVATPQDCPAIQFQDSSQKMSVRQPYPAGLQPVCESIIPANAKSAVVNGQALALPSGNPKRVVVIGDTGCRVKDPRAQACDDPAQWPFMQVATSAAAEKPDLVIHVGDYLYREGPCPAAAAALCGTTPTGDNWNAWNADFFAPAAKLLASAPWVFARGNHEECKRSWRGWFYYLDPRPLSAHWLEACEKYSPPYIVKLGKTELAMLDSAHVAEDVAEEKQVAEYTRQLAFFQKNLRGNQAWLVDHHPFWGLKPGAKAKPAVPISAPLEEAWDRAAPDRFSLILSGHIHLFELLSFDHGRPPQLVAGDAGTYLDEPVQTTSKGIAIDSVTVMAGESRHQFGYTVMTRAARKGPWELTLKNRDRQVLVRCSLDGNQVSCARTPPATGE